MPNFSGKWTLQAQMQATGAGNWTGIVQNNLYAWGLNTAGQLGQNDVVNRSSPVQVGSLSTWSSITGNQGNSITAIKTDGTLWSWGQNTNGQLGQNDVVNRSSPVQVGALTTWLTLSDNTFYHTVAIKTDGTLWSWGDNGFGQLGQGDVVKRSSPVQVGAGTTWSKITGGYGKILAIKTDGTLWAWGRNIEGQTGQNNTIYRSSPVQIGSLTTWLTIAGGFDQNLAIKTDGTLWSWGGNNRGQLGQNIDYTITRSSPVQVGALTTWNKLSASYNTIATKTDNSLWSWGYNINGQLGLNDVNNRSSPVQIGSLTTWLNIASGGYNTLSIKTDGTLWSWGGSNYGQLGQNNQTDRSSPVQVGSLTTWSKISGGRFFSLATTSTTT